jgi:uncharacterized protein YlxP (DUF503 family)
VGVVPELAALSPTRDVTANRGTIMLMSVGVAVFELHLRHSRSLKEKRRVVQGLVDRIHRRHRVSVAETGFQDLHQRSQISVAAVARRPGELERLMANVRDTVERQTEATVTCWQDHVIEPVDE